MASEKHLSTQQLTYYIKYLVGKEDAFDVSSQELDGVTKINVFVDSACVGKVLGKNGTIACLIRQLLRHIASFQGHRVEFDVKPRFQKKRVRNRAQRPTKLRSVYTGQ